MANDMDYKDNVDAVDNMDTIPACPVHVVHSVHIVHYESLAPSPYDGRRARACPRTSLSSRTSTRREEVSPPTAGR